MTPLLIAAGICLFLSVGHVWWGLVHPFRVLADAEIDEVVPASLHACWYHVSIVFFVTAGSCVYHAMIARLSLDVFAVLWIMNLLCWLCYLGVLWAYPRLWRIAWGQVVLIAIVLVLLGWDLNGTVSAA
ncbi:MAG: hypothetical protein HQ526_01600 [Actinobacteria bacterium]|nr:hypothetical protein [Actinomycetota bacterium]